MNTVQLKPLWSLALPSCDQEVEDATAAQHDGATLRQLCTNLAAASAHVMGTLMETRLIQAPLRRM